MIILQNYYHLFSIIKTNKLYYLKYKILTKEEFKNIYNQYFDTIRRYIYYKSGNSDLATDIAQETFIKVWEKQFDFKSKKIVPLLYKISSDQFVNHIRRESVEKEYLKEFKFNFIEGKRDNILEYKELKQTYENALIKLSEKQREVFLMSRLEELTYKKIALRLEITVKAVEKRMSIALSELKRQLIYDEN